MANAYIYVEDNEGNREILANIVESVENYIEGYNSEIQGSDPGYIDIQFAAWDHTNANWFDGEKFLYDKNMKMFIFNQHNAKIAR